MKAAIVGSKFGNIGSDLLSHNKTKTKIKKFTQKNITVTNLIVCGEYGTSIPNGNSRGRSRSKFDVSSSTASRVCSLPPRHKCFQRPSKDNSPLKTHRTLSPSRMDRTRSLSRWPLSCENLIPLGSYDPSRNSSPLSLVDRNLSHPPLLFEDPTSLMPGTSMIADLGPIQQRSISPDAEDDASSDDSLDDTDTDALRISESKYAYMNGSTLSNVGGSQYYTSSHNGNSRGRSLPGCDVSPSTTCRSCSLPPCNDRFQRPSEDPSRPRHDNPALTTQRPFSPSGSYRSVSLSRWPLCIDPTSLRPRTSIISYQGPIQQRYISPEAGDDTSTDDSLDDIDTALRIPGPFMTVMSLSTAHGTPTTVAGASKQSLHVFKKSNRPLIVAGLVVFFLVASSLQQPIVDQHFLLSGGDVDSNRMEEEGLMDTAAADTLSITTSMSPALVGLSQTVPSILKPSEGAKAAVDNSVSKST